MGMCPLKMMLMIVTAPQILSIVIGYQQALPVVPARTKDIIVLLAPRRSILLAQARPLSVRMLLKQFAQLGKRNNTIARGLKEETVVDVHQAIEPELLLNPVDLPQ